MNFIEFSGKHLNKNHINCMYKEEWAGDLKENENPVYLIFLINSIYNEKLHETFKEVQDRDNRFNQLIREVNENDCN